MVFIQFQVISFEHGGVLIVFISILLIAIILSQIYSKKNRILRKLKTHPFKKIQLCKDDEYVKLKGKASSLNEVLISPIGKKKCVYYKVEIFQKRSNGKSSHWSSILKEEKFLDFILENQGEKAIVITDIPDKHKRTYLKPDEERTSGIWNDPPKFLDEYLKSHGKTSKGLFGFSKKMRYTEGVIEIGENTAIMGTANWKESDHDFDRYSSKTLFISGDSEHKLIITDHPKAQESKK